MPHMAGHREEDTNAEGTNSGGLLGGIIPDALLPFLDLATSSYLSSENIGNVENYGKQAVDMANLLTSQAASRGTFQPFTVTSGLANVGTTAEGGFNVNLSPEQQALQSDLLSQAQSAFGEIGADRATREQEIYNNLVALRQPQQEREQSELAQRIQAQGRTGLMTSAYGGTPEQLAMNKAIQEQRSADALMAMSQAGQERTQAFELGQGLLGASYNPQRQALDMLELGRGVAQIPAGLQQQVLSSTAELGGLGLQGYLQAAELAAGERTARDQNLAGLLTGTDYSTADVNGESILKALLKKAFGDSLFG